MNEFVLTFSSIAIIVAMLYLIGVTCRDISKYSKHSHLNSNKRRKRDE